MSLNLTTQKSRIALVLLIVMIELIFYVTIRKESCIENWNRTPFLYEILFILVIISNLIEEQRLQSQQQNLLQMLQPCYSLLSK